MLQICIISLKEAWAIEICDWVPAKRTRCQEVLSFNFITSFEKFCLDVDVVTIRMEEGRRLCVCVCLQGSWIFRKLATHVLAQLSQHKPVPPTILKSFNAQVQHL